MMMTHYESPDRIVLHSEGKCFHFSIKLQGNSMPIHSPIDNQ